MARTFVLLSALILFGCGSSSESNPDVRATIDPNPVATYSRKVDDPLNKDWTFFVRLYETRQERDFIARFGYEEMRDTDLVHFPDMGYPIRPALLKGPDSLSCYIGFLDPHNQFMYLKAVWVERDGLHHRTVRKYTTQ